MEQGRDFYEMVFLSAIQQVSGAGTSYRAIRDTIRREWRP
jgi:hypothetical protein